ncbi:MAG: ATP-binding cassette domain-containing protein, partial [Pseudomonadales bacterium]|nr:ATP-binding cassette domain-containing protein [Pseudomonadales bacterium]
MSEPLVKVESVSVTLGGTSVLPEVSLNLAPGRITTLIGPNGAGKSTLARLVLGLVTPDQGTVVRRRGL